MIDSTTGSEIRGATTAGSEAPAYEPWFVLGDVCKVLEISNPGNAKRRVNDADKGIHTVDTLGGRQQVGVINESGLYDVILDRPTRSVIGSKESTGISFRLRTLGARCDRGTHRPDSGVPAEWLHCLGR